MPSDNEAAIATLRELLHEAEHGTLNCIALRIYGAGGNWEDVVFGGTQAEQAQALDHLGGGSRLSSVPLISEQVRQAMAVQAVPPC